MDCRTAESLINSYINKTMTLDELDDFLEHVKQCSSCYDELETYYTVYFAMQHLDNGSEDESFDMKTMLSQDIRKRENVVRNVRIRRAILILLLFVVIMAILVEVSVLV